MISALADADAAAPVGTAPPPLARAASSVATAPPPVDAKTEEQLVWEREMDEAEARQRAADERQRREVEEARRAEYEQRKRRERERLRAEEDQRRESNDRQKMLESLERSLTDLLDKMGLREELALMLARNEIFSLETLLAMPRQRLAECLGILDMSAVDRVVVAANRATALERISSLQLPEDEEWEREAALKREAETAEAEEIARQTEMGHYASAGYYASRGRGNNNNKEEPGEDKNAAGPAAAGTGEAEKEKPPVGPLRMSLLAVVEKWFDYLGTMPQLSDQLARAARGERTKGELGGPTWRNTVNWSLWMLTTKTDQQHLHEVSTTSSTGGGSRMSRQHIQQYLKLAHEHVWRALYPDLGHQTGAEWRVYWQRVNTSFTELFSTKSSNRWKEAAAADARTAALRAGKSPAEQREAAQQAERLIESMLRTPTRHVSLSPTAERRPGPPVPTPQGMAANFNLANERIRAAMSSIPIQVSVKQDAADEVGGSGSADGPSTVVAACATWPPSCGQRATAIAAQAGTDRYKDTPSRYLDLVSKAGKFKPRDGADYESGARWCPPPAARRPSPSTHRGGQKSTRKKSQPTQRGPKAAPARSFVGRGPRRQPLGDRHQVHV